MSEVTDEPRSYRPALVALSENVRELVREFAAGLTDEQRVLTWTQDMTVRTLGCLDPLVYRDLARQFRGEQGVLLAALLRPAARSGRHADLDERRARAARERILAEFVIPAHREAFRDLRPDATEYVDDADDGDAHDPRRQSAIAMRPALSELDEWQARALSRLLDGFDERGDILDWSHDVLLATHGELGEEWVTRAFREDATAAVLTGETAADERGRLLLAADQLLPAFRDGVRVLAGRAGEKADAESEEREVPYA